jgi:hypothetical protein
VAAKLKALARERGLTFKEAVNTTLRRGLDERRPGSRPYRLKPRRLALRQGIDLDHALTLAAELEDAEIIRKLELRK